MSIDQLVNEFFEKLKDHPDVFPFLYNRRRKEFDATKDSIFYSGPYWTDAEPKAGIKALLKGKWLVSGEYVARFERAFSKKFNFRRSLMVNSGSSANLVLISALKKYFKWQDEDEVVVSPVGFPTTIAPLIQNNLKPCFVDIDFDSLNFSLDQVEKAITNRTRAIFVSPVLGNPMDLERLTEIAKAKDVLLVLDGCDSLGSKWKGKELSDYAFATTCSFYPAHHISTGEGGMVSSNDEAFVELARSFAWWGRACYCVGKANLSSKGACGERFKCWLKDFEQVVDHKYLFTNVGYNLKPLDMQGAIGLEQLEKIDEIHQKRKYHKRRIEALFTKHLGDNICSPQELEHADTSWFGVPFICKSQDLKTRLVSFLEENRIQTRNYFAGNILMHPAYQHLDDKAKYPNANKVLSQVFFVGCHPSYDEKMLEYFESVIKKFSENYEEVGGPTTHAIE